MACSKRQGQNARAWALSRAQHGVVARRDTFVLSGEELERRFLPITREVGLSLPKTKEMVNGFAAGYTRLRFSHWQVRYEAAYVREILARTVSNLRVPN